MSKPRPILGEMPWNVKKMIVESADTRTKISLRRTTKTLKELVDNSVIKYHEIALQSQEYLSTVFLKVIITPWIPAEFRLEFRTDRAVMNCWVSGTFFEELKDGDFIEFLAQKFTKVFRSPNAIVKTLEIKEVSIFRDADYMDRRERIMSAIRRHLSRLPHKINVECLKISARDKHDLVHFLPYMKPGILKTIHVIPCGSQLSRDFPLDTVEMEQWKKARCLNVHDLNLMLPERHTEHFDSIVCGLENLDLEQTKASIETILNGATKRIFYANRIDLNAIFSYLGQFENLSTPDYTVQKEFKIRRGAASCNVKFLGLHDTDIVVFYNPEKTSVGDYFDVRISIHK